MTPTRARAIAAVTAAILAFVIAQPVGPTTQLVCGAILAGLAAADWSAIINGVSGE